MEDSGAHPSSAATRWTAQLLRPSRVTCLNSLGRILGHYGLTDGDQTRRSRRYMRRPPPLAP
jgi:hypothetical protein